MFSYHPFASIVCRKFNEFLMNFSDGFKPRRRPRTYYQRRRERVRRQAEREAERLELESMQVHNDLSDSDSSDEDDDSFDFEYEDDDENEISENLYELFEGNYDDEAEADD